VTECIIDAAVIEKAKEPQLIKKKIKKTA